MGESSDSHGRVVSFENTIVIMTSNSGTSYKGKSLVLVKTIILNLKKESDNHLKETFRPEFLNRVDETVVFKNLCREDLTKIIHLMVDQFVQEIKEKNISLEVTDDAVNRILEFEYDEKFGARPLRRGVQKYIEDILSEKYIQKELLDGDTVSVDYKEDKFVYKIKH